MNHATAEQSLLRIFTPEIRKLIRERLALNWAGGYEYAICGTTIIEKISHPSAIMWDGKEVHYMEAGPDKYAVVCGESADHYGDFMRGRKIAFWGAVRDAVTPRRMLGRNPFYDETRHL